MSSLILSEPSTNTAFVDVDPMSTPRKASKTSPSSMSCHNSLSKQSWTRSTSCEGNELFASSILNGVSPLSDVPSSVSRPWMKPSVFMHDSRALRHSPLARVNSGRVTGVAPGSMRLKKCRIWGFARRPPDRSMSSPSGILPPNTLFRPDITRPLHRPLYMVSGE